MAAETRKALVNPFQAGDTVTIPAGTVYTSADPAIKGRRKTLHAETVVVDESFPAALVRTRTHGVLVRPQHIRVKNHGEYAREFNVTEKIVRLNGRIPAYEQLSADV